MRIRLFAALCIIFALCPPASAQKDVDPAATQMAMELGQPGEEHAFLERLAGSWNQELKMYMSPGAPPLEAEATLEAEMILGGRFLQQRSEGSFMGEPVESLNLLGYDRRHGVYTMVGFDTMGTYYITAQGSLREDGTLVLRGHDDDPNLGSQDYEFHIRIVGDDEVSSELHMSLDGSEMFKMAEFVSTRR